jgi:hypothetical protein
MPRNMRRVPANIDPPVKARKIQTETLPVRMMRWWADELDRMKELGTSPSALDSKRLLLYVFAFGLQKQKELPCPRQVEF